MTDYMRTRKAVCNAIRLLMHEATVDPRILDLPMQIAEEIIADTFDEADAVTALRAEVRKPGTWRKAKADEQAAWAARYEADQKAKAEAEASDPNLPLPFDGEEQAAE